MFKKLYSCIQSVKDTKFKAIHNKQKTNEWQLRSCIQSVKDTKFKAIHNPTSSTAVPPLCCIQSVKDTKFKAIHNTVTADNRKEMLYSICQRYIEKA